MRLHHGIEEGQWYTEQILPRHWERLAVVYVADVGLDHVGRSLGVERARLARSSQDWHHRLESGALLGTVRADRDGL